MIRIYEGAKRKNEQAREIQQFTTIQTNQRRQKPIPTKARAKKKKRNPLTILQTIRYKAGAKYDLIAAERIVSHICRRQGSRKNQPNES